LIELKSTVTEAYFHKNEKELVNFVRLCINEAEAVKSKLPAAKGDIDALNNLFRKYIYKYNEH